MSHPDVGERTRLFQAALEERRHARERVDELIPSEAVAALERLDTEVERTEAEMFAAWVMYGPTAPRT